LFKILSIFTSTCGYHSKILLLIFSILISAIGAYLVRVFGFDKIFIDISPSWGLTLYALVNFNTIYLKFLIVTKFYYLVKYTNSNNIPNYYQRNLYILINILLGLLLISIIIWKNDCTLISSRGLDRDSLLFIVIYSYLLSFSLASLWIEYNYQTYNDRDNSLKFKEYNFSKFQFFYYNWLLIILLFPISWFFLCIINLEVIHCSNASRDNFPSASSQTGGVGGESSSGNTTTVIVQGEDVLNQQSNSNDQSVVIRGITYSLDSRNEDFITSYPSAVEGTSSGKVSTHNQSSIPNKFKSNIQSNVNKQLQPVTINMENNFKNKQQNINVQVFYGNNKIDRSYTYSSPPQYHANPPTGSNNNNNN